MFRRANRSDESPESIYIGLRAQALVATLGVAAPDHRHVIGAVVDIPRDGGMVTVVSMADGTTSMYTSTGGGTVGAGDHADVAQKSHALLATLQLRVEMFPADDRVDLPQPDVVQITILTTTGRRRANVPLAAFWGHEPTTVVDIIAAIHEVITAIRQVSSSS